MSSTRATGIALAFVTALMVPVCGGTAAYAGLAFKKLYHGQR